MNSPPFSQNYNSTGKAFLAGKPADAGTLGPYPRSGSDPESVKNGFVARLAENPPAKSFYSSGFFNEAARDKQNFYNRLGTEPNFSDERDVNIGKDFLAKYVEGAEQRGLIPVEEMVSPANSSAFMSQQPGENIGPDSKYLGAAKLVTPSNSVNV